MPMEEMPRMRAQEGAPEYQGYTAQHVTRTADYRGFSQHGEVLILLYHLSKEFKLDFLIKPDFLPSIS